MTPSGDRPARDPNTEPIRLGSPQRKRAAITLGVIALCAIGFALIMVFALGSGGSGDSGTHAGNGLPTGPAVVVTGGPSASQPPSTGGQSHPSTQSSTTKPSHPSKSAPSTGGESTCQSSAPCVLPADTGDAIGALNKYRSTHGAGKVAGKVSKAAQKCALANGDPGSCPSGYFWEPVGDSGKQVIEKIAAQAGGSSWLLNSSTKKYAVGWAYIPSSKTYSVALVAIG